MADSIPRYSSQDILALRGDRNALHPSRPYACINERERNANGEIVDVATLFLTNRECPFRCLMCDLWQNTLVESVPLGAIPEQIRFAFDQLRPAREIKLYNSGSFFDPQAIPPDDDASIAELVRGFDTVIVECHPRFCGERTRRFQELIAPAQLEIAIGLETAQPEVLAALNKAITLDDYERASEQLTTWGIRQRTFLLHPVPFLRQSEAADWTLKSIDYAFQQGSDCCVVIPTRSGNGMMDRLEAEGHFASASGSELEDLFDTALSRHDQRVFLDLWEIASAFPCLACQQERIDRLEQMNLQQTILPRINCSECE